MKVLRRTKLTPKYLEGGTIDEIDNGIIAGANFIPGVGPLISGVLGVGLKAGNAVAGDGTSRGRQIAGDLINPLSGLNSALSGNFAEAIPGFGSILKSNRLKREKSTAETTALRKKTDSQMASNQTAGALNRSAYPGYQAPAYGANGMKLNTPTTTKKMDNKKMEKPPLSIKGDVEDILKLAYGGKVKSLAEGGSLADGGMAQGPSHEQGGIPVTQEGTGAPVAEIEGGERVFSQEDTAAMEEAAAGIIQAMESGDQETAEDLAMRLGMAVVQMIAAQEQAQGGEQGEAPNQAAAEAQQMNSFQNG